MNRLRWFFILLALGLTLPLALLLVKARESLAVESDARHRAVAERIVDEMERELSAWLRGEEDRPYGHYRYFFLPEESSGEVFDMVRSPLSEPSSEPFVVGYFQVDPDGEVRSPLWPRNEELARGQLGWQPSSELAKIVDDVKGAVAGLWRPGPDPFAVADQQTVGSTEPVGKGPVPEAKSKAGLEEMDAASSLGLLESLNRGAQERQQRLSKLELSQAPVAYNFLRSDRDSALQEATSQEGGPSQLRVTDEVEAGIEETLQAKALERIDVRLEPMIGRRAAADRRVLYRTVLIGQRAYRQGIVIDGAALLDWLAERVLNDRLAAQIRLLPSTVAAEVGEHAYRHRFAEPFGSLSATLALGHLPEPSGSLYIHTLAALLALMTTVGLFALYRMVAVKVSFAERRSNFVSAVTHELKTPLTAIRMYGEMLRDGVVPSEGKRQRYYEIMTAEAERLTRLVQNVLELSRLEQHRPMQLVSGDATAVLREVIAMLEPHVEKEGFRFDLAVEADLPAVRFDRDALIQVLFNLVDNALKYSRQATDKTIRLRAHRSGSGVALAVADHGPGVAREHLKKIFEPFYRGENELTRTSKGTGIGLALVHGLIERMGGQVRGRNLDEGGFEVRLVLPQAS